MSDVGEAFIKVFGKPVDQVPNGIIFTKSFTKLAWSKLDNEIGAGWFLDRFVFLFGQGLEQFQPCLDAWSFLLKGEKERMIIGRNAYGALLIAEEISTRGLSSPVFLLDPVKVKYWTDPNIGLVNLVGYWLPEKKIPGFLNRQVYDSWIEQGNDHLRLEEILAIKNPVTLGGKFELENFQREDMISYYETTAPIYKKLI